MQDSCLIFIYQEDPYNNLFDVMFNDMLKLDNVYKIVENNRPHTISGKIFNSYRMNIVFSNICWFYQKNHYLLYKKCLELKKQYKTVNVLFLNSSFSKPNYPWQYLKRISKIANLYLLFMDPIYSKSVTSHACEYIEKNIFKKIYTLDSYDAKKEGFIKIDSLYSKIDEVKNNKIEYDLYFAGADYSREEYLNKVIELVSNKIKCRFDIVDYSNLISQKPNIVNIYEKTIDYKIILETLAKSKCILDVVKEGSHTLSVRPYEAVAYNKLLITNNPEILNFKYYDDRYMKLITYPNEIDLNWILNTNNIDYHYKNDYSSLKLYNLIMEGD